MLCSLCQEIFRGRKRLQWSYDHRGWSIAGYSDAVKDDYTATVYNHHPNLESLTLSAESGCHLCVIICDMPLRKGDANIYDPNIRYKFSESRDDAKYVISFELGRRPFRDICLYPFTSSAFELETESLTNNTSSPASWIVASEWLKDCLMGHAECNTEQDSGWLPTRLLDVGMDKNWPTIKLCMSSNIAPGARYTTLSHCWGLKPIITLKTANQNAYEKGIPILELSNMFRDAVVITRRLNVRYLWIDSLCIIQDSVLDWQRESVRMNDVYSNSFLNIAATGSSDGVGGLFRKRNPLLARPCLVTTTWSDPGPTNFKELEQGTYFCTLKDLWPNTVEQSPLMERAWVVQERFLTPRMLHFGEKQLAWECRKLQTCESYPRQMGIAVRGSLKGLAYLKAGGTVDKANADQISWVDVVHIYSKAKLTMPDDKLVASSGIAKFVQCITKDEYVAGLWKSDILKQLLWTGTYQITRPPRYRAPSWSWASVDSVITWIDRQNSGSKYKYIAEVVDVHVSNSGDDEMGAVTDGWIRLKGQLSKAHMRYRSSEEEIVRDLYIRDTVIDYIPHQDLTSDGLGRDLHCMPLRRYPVAIADPELEYDVEGLILEPTKTKRGQFRRFGTFTLHKARKSMIFSMPADETDLCFEEVMCEVDITETVEGELTTVNETVNHYLLSIV